MGKGDMRTRRGKIFAGSYGILRKHKVKGVAVKPKSPVAKRK
jgi:ribosomal small subunit protein bTHX